MATATDQIVNAMVDDLREAARKRLEGAAGGDVDMTGEPDIAGAKITSSTDDRHIVYRTDSGEPVLQPVNFLKATLKRRRKDGTKEFVAADPKTGLPLEPVPEYKRGTFMCFLHPDHPGRDELEAMGIGRHIICGTGETTPAAHIASAFDLRLHEEKRHPQSYNIRKEFLQRQTEERREAAMREQTDAILALAGQRQGAPQGGGNPPIDIFFCTIGDCRRFFDSEEARLTHEGEAHLAEV